MQVLAADMGGTKTLLAIVECVESHCRIMQQVRVLSSEYPDPVPMIAQFLQNSGGTPPTRACLAVAGPVIVNADGQRARLTNLEWKLDSRDLGEQLDIREVVLINDFQAIGYGIDVLPEEDYRTLQTGEPQATGTRVVLGPGTGLGQAMLVWNGDGYTALATEGGHVDFAPRNELQAELLRELQGEFGHVSWERVLSGPGLVRIYSFLQHKRNHKPPPQLRAAWERGNPAPVISQLAMAGRDAVAEEALEMFLEVFGSHAGNIALTTMATGGIFLAGGISAALVDAFQESPFLSAFNDKGRMSPLTNRIQIRLIRNPQVGLLGAAVHGARQ